MSHIFNFSSHNHDVYAFIDDHISAIMVKVASGDGILDPVELSSEQARDLARALIELADQLDRHKE